MNVYTLMSKLVKEACGLEISRVEGASHDGTALTLATLIGQVSAAGQSQNNALWARRPHRLYQHRRVSNLSSAPNGAHPAHRNERMITQRCSHQRGNQTGKVEKLLVRPHPRPAVAVQTSRRDSAPPLGNWAPKLRMSGTPPIGVASTWAEHFESCVTARMDRNVALCSDCTFVTTISQPKVFDAYSRLQE